MSARHVLLAGLALAAAALLAVLAAPAEALRAWLAAAVLWSGLPLGSLGLALTMRLTGGRWDRALPPFLEAGALTLPLACAALLPVLLGLGALYPWAGEPMPGFQGAWLAPLPFVLRTLILFLGAGAILWALVARRAPAGAVAAAGLLFLLPMQTFVLTDWLLSLAPGFHSSGFPLYAMSGQFNLAFMAAAALLLSRQPRHTEALGAIMITLTLTWLYLAFTHYIVIWSGDLAPLVGWYRERLGGLWGAAYGFCAAVETGVLLALLVPRLRRSAAALRAIAGAAILARIVEAAWLVLPAAGPMRVWPLLLYLLAACGLGLVFLSAQALILDRRVAARSPA